MQNSFEVVASSGRYKVTVDSGLFKKVILDYPNAIYLVDERLSSLLPLSISRKIVVEATEGNKSLERMPEIILKLRELGADRTSHLIAIGGGVIQDIATFAASVYMRGITWSYMPTTLLGMADSCIGGKSSINVLGYKNLVGNFYPPAEVLVDIDFVETLDAEKIVGGLYEAAKICYANSYQTFLDYLAEQPAAKMSPDCAKRVILRALLTKKWFIETDEFDQKERLLLNFGHTFGHAIEAGTDFEVTHGIAVGVGMLVAVDYSKRQGWLSQTGIERADLLVSHIKRLLDDGENTAIRSPATIRLDLVMEKFNNDKKHRADFYRMVCPRAEGNLELVSEVRGDDTRKNIIQAYESALSSIGWGYVAC